MAKNLTYFLSPVTNSTAEDLLGDFRYTSSELFITPQLHLGTLRGCP